MLRRSLLIVGSLSVALAIPAAAEASWYVKPPKKPKKVHVIAVRRGHHIIWKDRSHGRAKKKLRIVKLSSDFRFRLGARNVDPTHYPIASTTGTCPTTPTTDGVASYMPYGQGSAYTGAFSDVLSCFGGGGPSTMFYAAVTPPVGCNYPRADGTVVDSNAEFANYLDGEWTVVCGLPNDPSTSYKSSLFSVNPVADNNAAFKFVQQGFTCQATVPVVGAGGAIVPDNIRNQDSIEFYQSLGSTVSVTTSCIGSLSRAPGHPTPPSKPTTRWLSCLEYNPFKGSPSLIGNGVVVSYPDGQYSETCNVPNYTPPST